MENDILDSLNDLGYQGPLTEEVAFAKALDGGAKSLEFTKLVHILAEELKTLCSLEETVNIINDVDESSSFLLELSSFLKELGCPYKCLVTGHMSSRLQSKVDRLLLLDYLVSELMAARMVQVDCPKEKQGSGMEIVMQESPTAKDLKDILISLKFNKPPPNITLELLFSKMEAKLKDTIQKEGDKLVGKPLYNKALTDKDWKNLDTAYSDMYEEYRLRRETLITRLECTIQSFEWSDRLKTKKDTIQSVYRPCRNALTVKPAVKISDFLAARTTLLHVEKTSSASVRKNTQSDVNKVIIGRVPDRGGRPNEQQPPPPEMPSWQQRSAPQVKSRENDYSNYGPNLSWYFNEMMSNTDNDESTKQSNQTINISTQTKKSTQSNQSFDRNTPRENNTPPNKSLDTSTARKKRTHFNKRFDTSTPNEKSYQSKQSFATRTITEKTTPPNKTFDTFSRDKSTQPNQGFDKSTPFNQGSHKSATRDKNTPSNQGFDKSSTRDKSTPSNQGFDKSTASVKSSSPNQSFETSTSHTQSKQSFDINREKTTSSNKMFDPTIPREKSTPSNQVFDKSTSGEKSSQSNQSVNTPNEKSAVQSISLGTSRDNTTQSNKSDPKEISIENSDDSSNDVMILEDIKVILIEDSPSEEISPQNSQTHEEITNNSPKRPNLKRKVSQEDDSKPKIPKLSEERPKYEAYGQHIAERLRNMDQTLAVYCQKIINDAVFMAETNVLNCNSRIVNGGLFDNSSANEMIDVTSTQI